MLARFNRCFQHARVLERGRGDDHCVHIGRQELFEILIDRWFVSDLDALNPGFNAIVKYVAQRRYPGARIGVENCRIIRSSSAYSNQANRDSGIGLGATYRCGSDDGETGCSHRSGLVEEAAT